MGAWTALRADARAAASRSSTHSGPGSPRATSGDETRIIRSSHGADPFYTRWSREALARTGSTLGDEIGEPLFVPAGVALVRPREDGFEASSEATLRDAGHPGRAAHTDEVGGALAADPLRRPGVRGLRARGAACSWRAAGSRRSRGVRRRAAARSSSAGPTRPGRRAGGCSMSSLATAATGRGDQFVFAAGPWLPRLFPDVAGRPRPRDQAGRRVRRTAAPATAGSGPTRSRAGSTTTRRVLRHARRRRARHEDRAGPLRARRSTRSRASGSSTPRRSRLARGVPAAPLPGPGRRARSSRRASASTRRRRTPTSSSTAIRTSTTSGSSAAAPATASSTGRRSGATSRSCSTATSPRVTSFGSGSTGRGRWPRPARAREEDRPGRLTMSHGSLERATAVQRSPDESTHAWSGFGCSHAWLCVE